MPSATALAILVETICLTFSLQRAEVPLFCFNVRASERNRIHRLLQRGQKRSATATAITMFGSKVINLDRFAGSRFASFFNYYAHFFIINCALLTIYFTHRTKYIKIFVYNIQEFLASLLIRAMITDVVCTLQKM